MENIFIYLWHSSR